MKAYAGTLTRNDREAEDLVQMAALRAVRFYSKFDGRNFPGWFSVLMRRVFLSKRMSARRSFLRDQESIAFAPIVSTSSGEDAVVGAEIARAVSMLPDKHRKILCGVLIEQREYHEVAEQLQVPIGTVMSALHRARRRLQASLAA